MKKSVKLAFILVICLFSMTAGAINKQDLVDCLRGHPPEGVICPF